MRVDESNKNVIVKACLRSILLLVVLSATGYGVGHAQQFNFVQYSFGEGLLQSQVEWLFEDSRGYLWLGYRNAGVSRFDGEKLAHFNRQTGLPANTIRSITEDEHGQLWLAADEGIIRYDNRHFTLMDSSLSDVDHLFHAGIDTIYAATSHDLFRYDAQSGKFELMSTQSERSESGEDSLVEFFVIDDLLLRNTAKSTHLFTPNGPVQLDPDEPIGKCVSIVFNEDAFWMVTASGKITLIGLSHFNTIATYQIPATVTVSDVLMDKEGKLWLGTTNKGVFQFNREEEKWTNISELQGLPNNDVTDLLQDRWGMIWMATRGGGIVKYLGESFTHFDISNGLHGNRIYALCEDHNGHIWITASNNGIAVFNGTSFEKMDRDGGYIDLKSMAIHEDEDHNIWIGTQGGGIVVLDAEDLSIVTIEDGLPSSWVNNIIQDKYGTIWLSSPASGMARIERLDSNTFKFDEFNKADGLPDNYISTLEKDNFGNIWFATQQGKLGMIGPKGVQTLFDQTHGLPGSPVNCITFDDQNNMYVGTRGDGIFYGRYEKKIIGFQPLIHEEALLTKEIRQLIFDLSGKLYAGTDRGLYRFTLSEATVTNDVFFGRNEGFLGIETNVGAVLRDKKGNLWFGTMKGLTRHLPFDEVEQQYPPLIHFADISLFYESLSETGFKDWVDANGSLKAGLELPYQKNHLSFDFKGINLQHPERDSISMAHGRH